MSILSNVIKTGVAIKVIQIAKRELSKPENQRKIAQGLKKVQKTLRVPR